MRESLIMPRILGYFALIPSVAFAFALALTLALPAALPGQDKSDKAKDKGTKLDATLEDYQNLAKMKDVVGKIAAVDVTAGSMTLTIDWSHMEPNKNFNAANQKAAQQLQQMQRDFTQSMQAKNPVQRQQALARLQVHMQNSSANLQNMFHVVKATKDFDLVIEADFKVARSTPEQKFDEQGEVIKYTDDQLKKMKSPDITGAYKAKAEDLRVGQGVKLYLDPPPKDDKKKSDSDGDKKTDTGSADSKAKSSTQMPLSQVRMVLITDDSSATDSPDAGKKKKKDN
jgi:hypothetical protein